MPNMKVLLLLLVIVGSATALVGDEFFIHYVNNFMNQSVCPCDNFYRHVCSRNIQDKDRYREHAMIVINNYIREGAQKLEQTRNSTRFERILNVFKGDRNMRTVAKSAGTSKSKALIQKGTELVDVYSDLLRRMQYVAGIPDLSKLAPRELIHEIIELAETELQVTDAQYYRTTMQKFRETLATLNPEKYDEFAVDTYAKMFDMLEEFFTATEALETFDENNVHVHFEEILEVLGKYAPGLLNLRVLAPSMNMLSARISYVDAYYGIDDNSINFFDGALILGADASIPAKFGSMGFVIGHEMYHSLLDSRNWTGDYRLGRHQVCLASHMLEVCKVFHEGDCRSGPLTYDEDAADMESTQLLYKLMRNKMGTELKDPIPSTTVTNEQMFFYASAMFNCVKEDAHGNLPHNGEGEDWDTHSYAIPRVNGPFSLMKAFHDAFECKAGDRMFDVAVNREDCNAFGDPVRK